MWALFIPLFATANCMLVNAASAPALVWSTEKLDISAFDASSAMNEFSASSFLAGVPSGNVLLFLQDTLRVEDFSSFTGLQKSIGKDHLYLTKLEEPRSLQGIFEKNGFQVVTSEEMDNVASDKKNLIVVPLTRQESQQNEDRIISKVQSFKEKFPGQQFTFILTGQKSSIEESTPHMRIARSLQQSTEESNDTVANLHSSDCVLLYLRGNMTLSLTGEAGTFVPLPEESSTTVAGGSCATATGLNTLLVSYPAVMLGGTPYEVTLTFEFVLKQGWRAARVTVNMGADAAQAQTLYLQGDMMASSIPLGLSYSCGPTFVYRAVKQGTQPQRMTLRMNGVQMQAFMSNGTMFGPSWDCVGFFTPGIWMGLLSALLGLVILAYGMMMIASINTMDRFDDPRGKSITVVQED